MMRSQLDPAVDEFVVLVSGFDTRELITKAADRMQASVANIEWPLNASIGIAMYPEHANDKETLIACAERAMYEAKRDQNSRWCLYDQTMASDQNHSIVDKAA